MRARFFLQLSLTLLMTVVAASACAADPVEVTARRVLLDPETPERDRVGALAWRGGLELSAADRRFGGFSALLVAPDGGGITALSDRGNWLTATLVYDSGKLVGLRDAMMAPIHGLDGKPLNDQNLSDAESIIRLADGALLVGFEGRHRIWRYPAQPETRPLAGDAEPFDGPPDLARAPVNGGVEAMLQLADGAILVFTEEMPAPGDPGALAAFLQDGETWRRLSYRPGAGFKPTSAALLPGGDVLVLERRFTLFGGLAIRLARLDAGRIKPGARLTGVELALFRPPLAVDNMEGLAVRPGGVGEALVYLMSDDNFNPLQRTLLLHFALEE